MKRPLRSGTPAVLLAAIVFWQGACAQRAGLEAFPDAVLVKVPTNDGDSFLVRAGGKEFRVRLYYVDCPEATMETDADVRRVQEQMRYFGLLDPGRVLHFGQEAKAFTERNLSRPFTLYTAFAAAPGRTSGGRVYAFVRTADGRDLASLLVSDGLARARGVGRASPEGIRREEMAARLRDLEGSAMLKRVGIWAESDPQRIAALRAEQRSEEEVLQRLKLKGSKPPLLDSPLDVNTATQEKLLLIKGIGPVLAKRIVAGRPYKSVDELIRVKGIGPKTLEKIRPHLKVSQEPE